MINEDWQPMSTAPKNCDWVQVKTDDEKIHIAHYAEDLSGEDQPAFRGWFERHKGCKDYFDIGSPVGWKPLSEKDIKKMEKDKNERKAEEEKRQKANIHSWY